MSLPIQAKLLRVIQDGVVRRVGATAGRGPTVRFISATNRVHHRVRCQGDFARRSAIPLARDAHPFRRCGGGRKTSQSLPTHFLSHYWERHRGHSEGFAAVYPNPRSTSEDAPLARERARVAECDRNSSRCLPSLHISFSRMRCRFMTTLGRERRRSIWRARASAAQS